MQVVLNDDVGFGVSEVFGRLVTTPIIDKLAQNGIRYNLVYATVLCLPTHLAPLNGYYQDSNIMGGIAGKAKSLPGNPGAKLQTITPVVEFLRHNGYNTAAFGKYHKIRHGIIKFRISGSLTNPLGFQKIQFNT